MAEQRRPTHGFEVGLVGCDQLPVADVEKRTKDFGPNLVERIGRKKRSERNRA